MAAAGGRRSPHFRLSEWLLSGGGARNDEGSPAHHTLGAVPLRGWPAPATRAWRAPRESRGEVLWFASPEIVDPNVPATTAMVAGAAAGFMEHLLMFPVDTVKTRMQLNLVGLAAERPNHAFEAMMMIAKNEGLVGLYRGIPAVLAAAIPSHAVYFAVYEEMKEKLGGNKGGLHVVADGISGGLATMAHDAVVTPFDVVKQRLQMYKSPFSGFFHCIRETVRTQGVSAFYRSYPTTVLMNVPFMSVYFATYETLKFVQNERLGHTHAVQHMLAGAGAGALAGLVSNPLDVIKTRIQTHGIGDPAQTRSLGMVSAFKSLLVEEGPRALFRGTSARVMYFMPSAAIQWATYEFVKSIML